MVFALLLAAGGLAAEDLGQLAAREREKREKKAAETKPSGRKYDNDDLPKPEPGKSEAATSTASSGSDESGSRESRESRGEGSEENDTSPEKGWRSRAAEARRPIQEAEQNLAKVDEHLNEIRQRLSPFNPMWEQDTNKILALQEELRNGEAERESARQRVEEAKKAWEEFVENARKESVPPGWLEEPPR